MKAASMRVCAGVLSMAAVMSACAGQPVGKQAGKQADQSSCPVALAGEYSLAGVMETGSGLMLRSDCRFEWFFSYGALDLAAQGRWVGRSGGLELQVDNMVTPLPEYGFQRLKLRTEGDDLVPSWPWDMDAFEKGRERGRYARVAE